MTSFFIMQLSLFFNTHQVRLRTIGAFACALLSVCFALLAPSVIGLFIQNLTDGNVNHAYLYGLFVTICFTAEHVLIALRSIVFFPVLNRIIKKTTFNVAQKMHQKPLEKGLNGFASYEVVRMTARIGGAVRVIERFFFSGVIVACSKLLLATYMIALFGLLSPAIVLCVCLALSMHVWLVKHYATLRHIAWKKSDKVGHVMGAGLARTKDIRTTSFNRYGRIKKVLNSEADAWFTSTIGLQIVTIQMFGAFGLLIGLILYKSVNHYAAGLLSLADVIQIKAYTLMFVVASKRLSIEVRKLVEAWTDCRMVMEILLSGQVKSMIPACHDGFRDGFQVDNVTYSYKSKKPVFKNLSLIISQGQKVCVQGKSGAGKSTLIHLIAGLLKPDSGVVRIDNELSIHLIAQDSALFAGTIFENLTYGVSKIDPDKVHEALRSVYLYDFVMGLPDGMGEMLGEEGLGLSGGQIQRLLIARALLCSPDLLLIDEGTNALEPELEQAVVQTIFKKVSTVIIVSNKPEISQCADEVLSVNVEPYTILQSQK